MIFIHGSRAHNFDGQAFLIFQSPYKVFNLGACKLLHGVPAPMGVSDRLDRTYRIQVGGFKLHVQADRHNVSISRILNSGGEGQAVMAYPILLARLCLGNPVHLATIRRRAAAVCAPPSPRSGHLDD